MIRAIEIKAKIDSNYCESIIIDNPLNKKGVCVDCRAFLYYAYRKARKIFRQLPCSHAEGATLFDCVDLTTGIVIYTIERYTIDGKKMIRFI